MAKRHYIPVTADVPGVSDEKKALIRRVIRTALAMQGVDFPCEVDVLVTSDAGIHQINRDMRQVDRPTDVLSFPEFELTPGELPGQEVLHLLGYDHLDEGPMKARMREREEVIMAELGLER